MKNEILKENINDAIVEVASKVLDYVLNGTSGSGIKHRALRLLEECSKIRGYIAMALWAGVLTPEEYLEYADLVGDMQSDAHNLAFFGEFI